MNLQQLFNSGLNENILRELYLYQIPILKTCDNWKAVQEVGRIDFKGKHANYNGALVQYGENVYFVPDSRLDAVSPYRKWNLKNKIQVITEVDYKKKKK